MPGRGEAAGTDLLVGSARVDGAVFALRPDYRVGLLSVDGIDPSCRDDSSELLLQQAEASARAVLAAGPIESEPHVAAWREAYRAFGAKPQRTRNSLEALLRRAGDGLPRVNPLTDLYNAVSVLHRVPLGGEDASGYAGTPRLLRASGTEPFDAVAAGEPVVEHPEPGEVVWTDRAGVTCRRWNWRQGTRTRLRDDTRSALFILDALAPMSDDALMAAVDALAEHVSRLGPSVALRSRVIGAAGDLG